MPGNKQVFQAAIKKGHNAAWDRQWSKAVAEYRRALAEFPDDVSVRLSLAHTLKESGQFESAMREYQRVSDEEPNDPIPLTHVAEMLVKMNRPGEAASTYLMIAEMYLNRRKLKDKAIEAWKKAAELEPERTDVHTRLAEAYEQNAQRSLAANEYLAISASFVKRGDRAKALNYAERAQSVDPGSAAARARVAEIEQAEAAAAEPAPSPVAQAEKEALSRLAETLLGGPAAHKEPEGEQPSLGSRPGLSQPEIDALIARAVDAQMRHRVSEAIESYRRLLAAGITRTEVSFNLGLLYFETMRYDDAVRFLTATSDDKNYGLASHFALGQCYRAQGKMDQAVDHFLRVTQIVDLGSVQREQADDLISVYEELADSYAAKGDRERSESFGGALEKFLTEKGWEDKAIQVRHHLESLRSEGGQVSLAEVSRVPGSDKVLEALALAQEYVRRDKLWAAGEECYRAIELAPNYMPGHVRLAEILVKQGQTEEARSKYETLAELSLARGDVAHAEGFYRTVLNTVGDNVNDRSRLIDLLLKQGRTDDALKEYLILGEGFAREENYGKAADKFAEGIRIAARSNVNAPVTIALQHRLAEARMKQGEFKAALAAYQEIHQHSPDDERARFYAVDLQFRLGQPERALQDLEELLQRYQSRGEPQRVTAVLEALAQSYTDEPGLLDRLARNYVAIGAHDKAIATLDTLGELYLSSGQKQSAATTIRQILAMQPPRASDYEKLLEQIGE